MLDLNQILKELSKTLGRLIGEHILLNMQPAERAALVKADMAQFQQVIFNLALNARDAMPSGGKLSVMLSHESIDGAQSRHFGCAPGEYVCLTVADNGKGIDPAILPHIFEPFFTTKEAGKGTGLGLATVHGIAQQSSGCVRVESQLAKGATFRVYFPAAVAKPASSRPTLASQLPKGSETILLVEDEKPLAAMVYEFLKGLGYNVLLAHDGQQAADMAAGLSQPVDLLVTDIVMPNMTGAELARGMRLQQPHLRVVLVSGYEENGPAARNLIPEGMTYVRKPFTLSVLARKVREALDAPAPEALEDTDKTGT
jgi:CheY-like chemotaxis protein